MEADALTNLEFQGFDEKKRIRKELGEVEFILLHDLMREAAEMNEELKMVKSYPNRRSLLREGRVRQDGRILGEGTKDRKTRS